LFDDDSAIRRVNREGVLLLGGGRALLMQIAHPAVAAGVAEHSNYRNDRWGRLLRTLRPIYAIAFGTPEQVEQAAAQVNAVHTRVVGAGYRAGDPELLRWVLATLIDTGLFMYERFVRPLAEVERERYYLDMTVIGQLLGLGRDDQPRDIAAFRRYRDEMLATIEVSASAREIAVELFRLPRAMGPAGWVLREVTTGLLPPRLRTQFELTWDPRRDAALETMAGISRLVLPRVPQVLRRPPALVMPPRP
jgi:uncharacterized protein (DUF2236 family)